MYVYYVMLQADNEIKGDMVNVNSFLDELSGRSGELSMLM